MCKSHSVAVFNHDTCLSADHGEKTVTLAGGRCSPLRCQDDAQRQAGGKCRLEYKHFFIHLNPSCTTLARRRSRRVVQEDDK